MNVGAGLHTLKVTGFSGSASATATFDFTVVVRLKQDQVITFGPLAPKTVGDPAFALGATASSGLPVSYTSSNTAVASVSGNTVTIIAAGSTIITATQAGDANYNAAAPVSQTLTVNKANQTISFGPLASKTVGDSSFALGATASSGLAVSYTSSNTAVATVSGNTVTIVAPGNTIITATQPGNANYNAATPVTQTLTVNKANQTITFGTLPAKTVGDAPFALTATASSNLPVSYTSSNSAVATVSGNTVTIVAPGNTIITATQPGNANYDAATPVTQPLTVNKANQTITFGALVPKTVGDPAFTLGGTASSGLAVTYTSLNTSVATVSGNTVTIVGAGSTTITASQAGNANYNAAIPVAQPLTVNKANQTITFGTLPAKTVGDAPFTLTATASSNLPVSYTSLNTAVATVSGNTVTIVGAGTTTITANQAGDANYNAAAPVAQSLTVAPTAKLTVTITKPDGALITRVAGSPATVIPFLFKAVATDDKIKSLSAKLGTSSLSVSAAGLYTATATGSGTLSVSAAGFYTFTATATTTAGLTKSVSVTFQVKETQPAPQTCVTKVVWLPPISLGKVQQGGSVLPIKFLLQQCCTDKDDDRSWRSKYRRDDDDDCGSYNDDDWDNRSHHGGWDYSGGNVSCRHDNDGKSRNNRNCEHDTDHDDEDRDGCANLRDKTVVISIYEVGSSSPAKLYRYGTGSPNPPDYAIDGDYQYHLNFATERGTHRYHIDVYRFPAGTTTPVLVSSKEFSTK